MESIGRQLKQTSVELYGTFKNAFSFTLAGVFMHACI